ncbi:hypothetical protein AA313_de0207958 [Arthrobotrys entomopaga]|nr:hypothetical protein AA313_de0207958 [Arthrobotrys entomopaga]
MSSSAAARWVEWPSFPQRDLLVMAMTPSRSTIRRLSSLSLYRHHSLSLKNYLSIEENISTLAPARLQKPMRISSGGLELTKWIALLFMTGDHVNKYLFYETLPYLFEAGRLALPLFVLVLAYNLARPDASTNGSYNRISIRLILMGLLSSIPYIRLGNLIDGWYPLNNLFTLLVITTVVRLIEKAQSGSAWATAGALVTFLVGGALVEFWWPAIIIGLGAWFYFKTGNLLGLLSSVTACASLWYINDQVRDTQDAMVLLRILPTPSVGDIASTDSDDENRL